MIKLKVNQFKCNLEDIITNDFATHLELIIIKFFYTKIIISKVVSKKNGDYDCSFRSNSFRFKQQFTTAVCYLLQTKYSKQSKTMATLYKRQFPFNVVPKATNSILELSSSLKNFGVSRHRIQQTQQEKFAYVTSTPNDETTETMAVA